MNTGVNLEGVLFDNAIPKPYLHACLKGLQMRNFTFDILADSSERQAVLDLLFDTGVDPYIDLMLITGDNKYEMSKKMEMKTQIMVEHRLDQAKHFINAKIPVVLFNTLDNQDYEHRLLHRVNNWWDAYQALARLQILDKGWLR